MKKFEVAQQAGLVPRQSDTSRDMTLRNANEHKRLEGRLKRLNSQLHHNLVSLQTEIMELKASPYAQSAARVKSTRQHDRTRTLNEGTNRVQQPRQRAFTEGSRTKSNLATVRRTLPEAVDAQVGELVLPEIGPVQTALVSQTAHRQRQRGDNVHSRTALSKGLLYAPSPPSLYRSLPDLNSTDDNNKRPRRIGKFTTNEQEVQQVREERSADKQLSDRVSAFIKKPESCSGVKEVSQCDNPESDQINEVSGTEVLDIDRTQSRGGLEDKGLATCRNTLLLSSDDGLSVSMPDLASFGFMDFNEVIDKRLKHREEKPPSEEEMRKVRYLRWRNEPKPDILTVFDKDDSDDNTDTGL